MPQEKSTARSFRLSEAANKRLGRLSKITSMSDTAIIEQAIAHLLGTLERDNPIWLTSPGDPQKSHKRGPDAA